MIKTRFNNNKLVLGENQFSISTDTELHKSDINFLAKEFNTIWPNSFNSNFTISSNPLKLSSGGLLCSMYSESSVIINPGNVFHFEYGFSYQSPAIAPFSTRQMLEIYDNYVTPNIYLKLEFRTGTSYQDLRLTFDTIFGSIDIVEEIPIRNIRVRISITKIGFDQYIFVSYHDGESWIYIKDPNGPMVFPIGPGDNVRLRQSFFETLGINSQFSIKPFVFYPFVDAPLSYDYCGYPTPLNFNQSQTTYTVSPAQVGDFVGTIYGVGSKASNSEEYDISVLEDSYNNSELVFLNSPINRFDTDDVDDLTCPDFSLESNDNKGDMKSINLCFCDGSELDGSIVSQVYSKSGKTNNKDFLPEFQLLNESGNLYGENFDFNRILLNESALTSDSLRFLRILPLSDGRRLFYGVKIDDNSITTNNHFIYIRWESETTDQDGVPGITLNRWVKNEADDTLIDFQSYPGTYNIVTDSEMLYSLPDGRYTFHFNKSLGAGYANDNLRVQVFLGTDDTGEKLVEWPTWRRASAYQELKLDFEIKQTQGELVVGIHDPCDGSIQFLETGINEINVKTDSLSAVELNDGRVVILYDLHNGISSLSSLGNEVFYRTVSTSPLSVSSPGIIRLPQLDDRAEQFIHCFDCYTDDSYFYILAGIRELRSHDGISGNALNSTSVEVYDYKNRKRALLIDQEPFISGKVYVYKVEQNRFNWSVGNTSVLNSRDIDNTFRLESIESVSQAFEIYPYLADAGDQTNYSDLSYPFAAPYKIRVNYNKDYETAVISVIDNTFHLGDIYKSNNGLISEVGYPVVFNQLSKSTIDNPPYFLISKLESLSADFGNDGFIYGVASTYCMDTDGTNYYDQPYFEFFQLDPLYMDSHQPPYLKYIRGEQFKNWRNLSLSEPEYNQSPTPVLSQYLNTQEVEYEKYDPSTLAYDSLLGSFERKIKSSFLYSEYRTDKHFGLLTLGGAAAVRPIVMQSSELDVNPFSTFNEEVYFPELYGKSDFIETNATNDSVYITLTDGVSLSRVGRDLTLNNSIRGKNSAGSIGYKFHSRIETSSLGGPGVDMVNPIIFETRGVSGVFSNSLLASPTDFARLDARFVIYGLTVRCEYWDQSLTSWVVADTVDLPEHSIYDYYILSRSHGIDLSTENSLNRGDFVFIIKQNPYMVEKLSNGNEKLNLYHNNYLYKTYVNNITLEIVTTESGYIRTYFAGGSSGESSRLYEQGWNVLYSDQGIVENSISVKNSTSYKDFEYLYPKAKRWRRMNDSSLLSETTTPNFGFRVNLNSKSLSSTYYYHNGFLFRTNGNLGAIGDVSDIFRRNVNNPSNLSAHNFNGFWGSQIDNKIVYIWADSERFGLSKFSVDAICMSGINFRNFTIVGKNDINDPWTEIIALNSDRYKIDDFNVITFGDKYRLEATGFKLGFDNFTADQHYVYIDNVTAPLLIENTNDDEILGSSNSLSIITEPIISIFSSRYNYVFNDVIKYRYFGIKIEQQFTYEGYYKINSLDFGKLTNIPCYESPKRTMSYEFSYNSKIVVDESVYNKNLVNANRSYELDYNLANGISAQRFLSIISDVAVSSRPIWVFENYLDDRFSAYLTIVDGELSVSELINEDEDLYYEINLNLRSVE